MSANDAVKRQVWVRCGGRCVICNEYLLEDHLEDGTAMRAIGEVAHIAAEKEDGPRGDSSAVDLSDRNEPANLILLCPNEHRSADKKRLSDPLYTESFLLRRKAEHEGFVRHVTGLRDRPRTTVLRMFGGIRTAPGNIQREEAASVVLDHSGRVPFYLPDPTNIGLEIDLHSIPAPIDRDYWASAVKQINARIEQLHRDVEENGTRHVSVFAIALLPALVALGTRLDDTVAANVYERHRHTDSWKWDAGAAVVPFDFAGAAVQPDQSDGILIINASGTIQLAEIPTELAALPTFIIAPSDGTDAGKSTFRNEETLVGFAMCIRSFLSHLEAEHKNLRCLHVFAAAPVSAAVELGRALSTDSAAPSLAIYHRSDGVYHHALTVPN